MYKNELLEVGENYGLLENPHFNNYTEINDYEQLKQYVRQHHKNGYGGFYSICNPTGNISHGIIMGFHEDGRFLLIDRQNNFIKKNTVIFLIDAYIIYIG